jgi:hypothetical protein
MIWLFAFMATIRDGGEHDCEGDSGNYTFDIGNAMCCILGASADSAVEAGAPVAIDKIRLALEDEFYDWRSKNDYLLSVGLPGDVSDLRLRLNAAFAKALMVAPDALRAI